MALTVEELQVSLKGDASNLQNTLKATEASIKNATATIEQQTGKITGFISGIKSFATTVTAVISALKIGDFLKDALATFKEMQTIQKELENASWFTDPGNWEEAVAGYKTFAVEIQKATATSEKHTLSLLAEAEALGITGAAAQKAVKGAIGLAKLTGFDAAGFLEAISFLEFETDEGVTKRSVKQMEALFPALSKIKDETERLNTANALLARGFDEAKKASKTWEGQLAALQNEYTTFKQQLGGILNDLAETGKLAAGALWIGLKKGLTAVADLVRMIFKDIVDEINIAWDGILDNTEVTWEGIKRAIANFGAFAKLIFLNIDKIITPIWTGIMSVMSVTVGLAADAIRGLSKQVTEFAGGGKQLVVTIGLIGTGILGAVIAFKTLNFTIALTLSVLSALKITQIASTVAWVAWTAAVVAAKVTMVLFNAQLVLWKALIGLATGATVVATVATTAWNASLAVTMALLAPATLLAAAGTIAIIGTVLVTVGTAAYAAWQTAKALVSTLAGIDTTTGPIAEAVSMFGRWGSAIKEVAEAAKKDLPLAFNLLKAHAKVALEEVKALFPAFFDAIKQGFVILTDELTTYFKLQWEAALLKVKKPFMSTATGGVAGSAFGGTSWETLGKKLGESFGGSGGGTAGGLFGGMDWAPFLDKIKRSFGRPIPGGAATFQSAQDEVEERIKELEKKAKEALERAGKNLKNVNTGFKVPFSEELEDARKELEKHRNALANVKPPKKDESFLAQLLKGMVDPKFLEREADQAFETWMKLKEQGDKLKESLMTPAEKFAVQKKKLDEMLKAKAIDTETYNRALQKMQMELRGSAAAMQGFNAVAFGSAEHISRLQRQADLLGPRGFKGTPGLPQVDGFDKKLAVGFNVPTSNTALALFHRMANGIDIIAAKDEIELEGANVG